MHIPWRNDESEFRKWCEGKTGFPIVDAGMRELSQTGYMHNWTFYKYHTCQGIWFEIEFQVFKHMRDQNNPILAKKTQQ